MLKRFVPDPVALRAAQAVGAAPWYSSYDLPDFSRAYRR
jgi:hypothetical protein